VAVVATRGRRAGNFAPSARRLLLLVLLLLPPTASFWLVLGCMAALEVAATATLRQHKRRLPELQGCLQVQRLEKQHIRRF
jgi:hypothetical protein